MTTTRSLVAATRAVAPAQAEEHLRLRLAVDTEAADVHHDLEHGVAGVVAYCDGIGCNGSTKGAYLALLGFRVKEMLGGLDWWRREGYPVTVGSEPGSLAPAAPAGCGC